MKSSIIVLLLLRIQSGICLKGHSSFLTRKVLNNLSAKDSFFNQATSDVIKRSEDPAIDSKAHKNKYKSFSKNLQDPLLVKFSSISKLRSNGPSSVVISSKETSRGTTVPVSSSRSIAERHSNSSSSSSTYKSTPIIKSSSIVSDIQRKSSAMPTSVANQTTTSQAESTPQQQSKPKKTINNKKYLNSIQPSDPFTFGYVEIGCILNPHGVKGEIKLQASIDDIMINDLNLIKGSTVYLRKPNRRTPRPIQLQAIRKQNNNIYLLYFHQIETREMAEGLKGYQLYIRKADRPKLNDDEYMIRDLVGMKCYLYYNTSSIKSMNKVKNKGEKHIQSNKHDINIDANDNDTENEELLLKYSVNDRDPVGVIEGVVPPDELCSPEMAKLMHSLLELRLFPFNSRSGLKIGIQQNSIYDDDGSSNNTNGVLCLIPLVPQIVKYIDRNRKLIVFDPPIGLLDLTYIEKKKYIVRGFLPVHVESLTKELRRELEMATVLVSYLPPFMMTSNSNTDDDDDDD